MSVFLTIRKKIQQVYRLISYLKKLSELPEERVIFLLSQLQNFSDSQTQFLVQSNLSSSSHTILESDDRKVIPLKQFFEKNPRTSIRQSDDSNASRKEVGYFKNDLLSDSQRMEIRLIDLPLSEKKLIIYVTDKPNLQEGQLLEFIEKNIAPESLIQKNHSLNADILEISEATYSRQKPNLYKLEDLFGDEYAHYVYLYPQDETKIYAFTKKSRSLDFHVID